MGWFSLSEAGNIGSLVGGLATVVGVVFAIVELRSWRGQRRAEKRSDAAAQALYSVREAASLARICEAMIRVACTKKDAHVDEARKTIQLFLEQMNDRIRVVLELGEGAALVHLTGGELRVVRHAQQFLMLLEFELGLWLRSSPPDTLEQLRHIGERYQSKLLELAGQAEAAFLRVAWYVPVVDAGVDAPQPANGAPPSVGPRR